LVERSVGNRKHAYLLIALGQYIWRRQEEWNVEVYGDLRIRARDGLVPDSGRRDLSYARADR
jgi:hypothetical protein